MASIPSWDVQPIVCSKKRRRTIYPSCVQYLGQDNSPMINVNNVQYYRQGEQGVTIYCPTPYNKNQY